MPTYILLSKLTPKGLQTLHQKPGRLAQVNLEITDLGFKVLAQYAVLGEYDFLTVIEGKDNAAIAHLSVDLGSRGTVLITTLTGIDIGSLERKLKGSVQAGHVPGEQHARFFDKETGKWAGGGS